MPVHFPARFQRARLDAGWRNKLQRAEDASELVQVAGDGVNWILAKIGSRQAREGRRAARVGGGGGRATLGAWPLTPVGSCRLDGILAVCMRRSQYLGDCFFASIFAQSYLDSVICGGRERPCPGMQGLDLVQLGTSLDSIAHIYHHQASSSALTLAVRTRANRSGVRIGSRARAPRAEVSRAVSPYATRQGRPPHRPPEPHRRQEEPYPRVSGPHGV